jgi:hypothetical protein
MHIILKHTASPPPLLVEKFYRLDFYDSKDSSYFDLKRNHHYLFTINKIRSEGYPTVAQAREYPGSNIEYTIRDEENVVNQRIISNGQYAIMVCPKNNSLTSDTVRISNATYTSSEDSYTVATVRQKLSDDFLINIGHSPSDNVLINSTIEITSGHSWLTKSTYGANFLTNFYFPLKVEVALGTPIGAKAVITIQMGNISYNMVVINE